MEKMNNVVIDRAERGKSGTESWGAWQAWSVWFVGMEPKFDYFERDNVIPYPGMQVNLVEYTVEQNEQYTNYKIKKMVPATLTDVTGGVQGPPSIGRGKPVPPSSVSPAAMDFEKAKRLTMCTSYAKDLMIQVLVTGDSSYRDAEFSALIDLVAKGGKRLAEKISEVAEVKPEKPVTMQPLQPGDTVGSSRPESDSDNKTVTPEMVGQVNAVLEQPPIIVVNPKEVVPSIPQDDDVPF